MRGRATAPVLWALLCPIIRFIPLMGVARYAPTDKMAVHHTVDSRSPGCHPQGGVRTCDLSLVTKRTLYFLYIRSLKRLKPMAITPATTRIKA
jgi:hypothetical protein